MNKRIKLLTLSAITLITLSSIFTVGVKAEDIKTSQASYSSSLDIESSNPVISYEGKRYDQSQSISNIVDNASFNYVPVGLVWSTTEKLLNEIKSSFSATASVNDSTQVPLRINIDKVNLGAAGRYPATVSATNASGKTTTLSFNVYVGERNSGAVYKVAKSYDGGNLYVFRIREGKVSKASLLIPSGTDLATFGTVTVNNVSYTQLNGLDSDIYIHTSDLKKYNPALFPNNNLVPVTKTLMHSAILYTQEQKSLGIKYPSYKKVEVRRPIIKIKGEKYYMLFSGPNYNYSYIKASNIDGTKRTLKHNAYVYETSTKRANKEILKKGSTVITYGGSYKFKNKKRYYRIEGATKNNKRYVKVANFK